MPPEPIKPKPTVASGMPKQSTTEFNSNSAMNIVDVIVRKLNSLTNGLKSYPIRELVKHAEEFGPYLKQQRLETNQIRKFLDAVNQLKARLAQSEETDNDKLKFAQIEDEIVLLKPKLAYAAARQKAAKPMSEVMSAAIDKIESAEDFERFVQLIESIIAYHKAEGGK